MSDPDANGLADAVEAVLAIHHRREVPGRPNLYPHCGVCAEPWPCRNYKLIREAIFRAHPDYQQEWQP